MPKNIDAQRQDFDAWLNSDACPVDASQCSDSDLKLMALAWHAASNCSPTLLPSEAVIGFASWLTVRQEPITLGAAHLASPAADLVERFCKSQGLAPCREDGTDRLRSFPED